MERQIREILYQHSNDSYNQRIVREQDFDAVIAAIIDTIENTQPSNTPHDDKRHF